MARPVHLVTRFFGSLRPGGPRSADREWAEAQLLPAELELWRRMSGPDRRHSAGVARRVERALGEKATRPVLAAALLHDVGKLDARLGVFGRVAATVAGATAGHGMADAWSEKRGMTRRFGLYLRHPELGASRIRMCEGSREAAVWAEAHQDPDRYAQTGIPPIVVDALAAADDD